MAELRHRDLHAASHAEVKSLREWKAAQDQSRRQKDLLFSVQGAARPERGILLEHGPDFSLDPVIDCCVEDDRPAEQICPGHGKSRSNRALDIPRTDALGR